MNVQVVNQVVLDFHTYGYLRKPTKELLNKERKDNGFKDILDSEIDKLKEKQDG